MSESFKALILEMTDGRQSASVKLLTEQELMEGDTLVRVSHSTLNYKDGLAITGRAPIARRHPMVAGIDFAGVVESTADPRFQPGDAVIANGWGMSETHFGGLAGFARVKGEWLVPLPQAFSSAQVMAIGTAGYTAMLAVMALEDLGVTPSKGPVLVTGAAGGVGSVAITLLHKLGYTVIASTGRTEEAAYLKDLGASEIIPRSDLSGDGKPIGRERWSAAIDSVGSKTLVNALAMTKYGGAVAACGLAQGMDLPGSVAPFILRGVTLAGIDSVMCPRPKRLRAWERLALDLDKEKLGRISKTIGLSEVIAIAPEILAGRVRGRIVVDIAR
jgi:acrylyl-CoA reductase (NADPH)